ncbi:hypothetical protein PR202_gb05637 [Eleusine coracana subsp. coracana]|uniref:Uncharacterized protein n=1 Tax=Eleusine coracana subsp. coracana TaxID=191504 RepID=A0AAV5E7E9_ELECO|nr:hypothetical protein PR202_gb05637 [Eleusine coracana subsp. coracana]
MCARRSSENRETKREQARGERGEREGEFTVVAGRRLQSPCPEMPRFVTNALPWLAPPPRCPHPYTPEGKARATAWLRSARAGPHAAAPVLHPRAASSFDRPSSARPPHYFRSGSHPQHHLVPGSTWATASSTYTLEQI